MLFITLLVKANAVLFLLWPRLQYITTMKFYINRYIVLSGASEVQAKRKASLLLWAKWCYLFFSKLDGYTKYNALGRLTKSYLSLALLTKVSCFAHIFSLFSQKSTCYSLCWLGTCFLLCSLLVSHFAYKLNIFLASLHFLHSIQRIC